MNNEQIKEKVEELIEKFNILFEGKTKQLDYDIYYGKLINQAKQLKAEIKKERDNVLDKRKEPRTLDHETLQFNSLIKQLDKVLK